MDYTQPGTLTRQAQARPQNRGARSVLPDL